MEWPAQSPDMNPIENVLKLVKERAKEKNPRNFKELWPKLKREWDKVSVNECNTLIRSCSKRCQAVIESKGLHIKYEYIRNSVLIKIGYIHYYSMVYLIVLIFLLINIFLMLENYSYNFI